TVLSNGSPHGVPEGLTESFFDWALDGELENDWMAFAKGKFAEMDAAELAQTSDFSQPPAKPGSPLAFSAYVGKYENDYFGMIDIAEKDGKLTLGLGPQLEQFALTHWDRDVFWFQPTGEMSAGQSGVIFSIEPNGRAGSVR